MRVQMAGGLAPAVARAMERVLAPLGAVPYGATIVVGADDPTVPSAAVTRPLVVVPASGPGRPTPWGAALLRSADAVVLLDTCEVHAWDETLADRPVVLAGLPAPAPARNGAGLDTGDASDDLLAAWRHHGGDASGAAAGVAWVGGRGVAPLARALEAWAAGRAVVALPGTEDHELLHRGRALRAHSPAEAIEATLFLLRTPALSRVLAARGRAVAARMPEAGEVTRRVLEGVELARQSAGGPP